MKPNFWTKIILLLLLVTLCFTSLSGCANRTGDQAIDPMNEPAAQNTGSSDPAAKYYNPEASTYVPDMVDRFLSHQPVNEFQVEGNDRLKEEMLDDALVIDVRSAESYARGHVPGSVNIPLREIASSLDNLPRKGRIILVCDAGHESAVGLTSLYLLAYYDVRSFKGGYDAWIAGGGEASTELEECWRCEPPPHNEEMLGKVHNFLENLPSDLYSVGDTTALKEMMAKGAMVIDLREDDSFSEGHIPGSVNIPLRELYSSLKTLPKDQPVVLSCACGHRACMGVTSLRILGYTNVYAFPAGFEGWVRAGEQVER